MQSIDFYEENADGLLLEQFIHEHRTLVKKIALKIKRRLPSHIEVDDLLQSGFVGLLEARKQYKNDRGATFETFASTRIHGAIIDALRKNSWGTREAMKQTRLIGEAINRFEQRHQKQPTSEEIAVELGISVDEHLKMCQQISISNVVSLDALDEDYALLGDDTGNPGDITQHEEMLKLIKDSLPTLPEREQLVLSLYYVEEFTFSQIGEILNLTEARICQLHSQSIGRLQEKLRKE